MITLEVVTCGLNLNAVSVKLSREFKQELVERLADVAYAEAFYGAPWRTGQLAGSITKQVGVGEAVVEAAAPYAVFVERGTAPHVIRPVRASVLAFEVEGRMVFTPVVQHPGTKADPFMQRAAEKCVDSAAEVADELWMEMFE